MKNFSRLNFLTFNILVEAICKAIFENQKKIRLDKYIKIFIFESCHRMQNQKFHKIKWARNLNFPHFLLHKIEKMRNFLVTLYFPLKQISRILLSFRPVDIYERTRLGSVGGACLLVNLWRMVYVFGYIQINRNIIFILI